jgi:putative membrane protein
MGRESAPGEEMENDLEIRRNGVRTVRHWAVTGDRVDTQLLVSREPDAFILENHMIKLLVHWVLSALCLLLVAHFVPGFMVSGFGTALIAAVVIGLVNSTLGLLLKIITFPLTILTLGIFWLVINALMLKFASLLVPGFVVVGLWPAFLGAIILSLLNMVVRMILKVSDE